MPKDHLGTLVVLFAGAVALMILLAAGYNSLYEGYEASNAEYGPKYDACDPESVFPEVQASPTEKAQKVARCEYQEKKEKSALDRRIANATDNLASYTLGLEIATIILATFTAALVLYAVRQASDSKASAEAAARSARAAERALEGSDAPFIFPSVRAFDGDIDPSPPGRESVGFACYNFKNYGRSPAIIREVYHCLIRTSRIPQSISFPPPQSNSFLDSVIGPGDTSEIWRFSENAIWGSPRNTVVFLLGQARFNDVFGNYFIVGFCFAHRAADKSFYAIGGTTHNYQRKLTEEEQEEARLRDTRSTQT